MYADHNMAVLETTTNVIYSLTHDKSLCDLSTWIDLGLISLLLMLNGMSFRSPKAMAHSAIGSENVLKIPAGSEWSQAVENGTGIAGTLVNGNALNLTIEEVMADEATPLTVEPKHVVKFLKNTGKNLISLATASNLTVFSNGIRKEPDAPTSSRTYGLV